MTDTIEQRLSRLEAAMTSVSPTEETLPTYLSIDPATGAVTATFTGNIILTEGQSSTSGVGFVAASAIQWVSSGVVQGFIQEVHSNPPIIFSGHSLTIQALNDALTGQASLYLQTDSAPSASIAAGATDGAGNTGTITIVTAKQQSGFWQVPTNSQSYVTIGTISDYPNSPARQPNLLRATLVIASVFVSTTPGMQTYIMCDRNNPPTTIVASIYNSDAAAIPTTVPCTFICPPGWYYILYVAGAVGTSASMNPREITI